ncbi:MAG TPA: hydroxyacylglutathione hydrolase [Casimicrobiaceae bacterium]|nr:hydroxyacylglutathione hydrolase [Casimicrobiaceae bacterium]
MSTIIPVGAFTDNYVWILRRGAQAVAVDPGDAAPVAAYLERENLTLTAIIATHHHNDHVGGIPALVGRWQCPVYGPARESIPNITTPLREGDHVTIDALSIELRVIDIPGHTAGHVALTGDVGGTPALFCGDTLFAAGCGRLFEGTPEQMWSSLSKLAALAPGTRVYCGHEYTLANLAFATAVEPTSGALRERNGRERAKRERGEPTLPSTIGDERATNPFLRVREPEVRASAQAQSALPLVGDVAVFAALREWKNRF